MHEPPLETTRFKFSLNCCCHDLSQPSHPLQNLIIDCQHTILYPNRPSCVPSFDYRVWTFFLNTELDGTHVMPAKTFQYPPWQNHRLSYLNPFGTFVKINTIIIIFQYFFAAHRAEYRTYPDVYTDGFTILDHVGAVFIHNSNFCFQFLSQFMLFSLHSWARHRLRIFKKYILQQNFTKFIIYSDLLSTVKAFLSTNPLLYDIIVLKYGHVHSSYTVLLSWIPSHVGISGNDNADGAENKSYDIFTHPTTFAEP